MEKKEPVNVKRVQELLNEFFKETDGKITNILILGTGEINKDQFRTFGYIEGSEQDITHTIRKSIEKDQDLEHIFLKSLVINKLEKMFDLK